MLDFLEKVGLFKDLEDDQLEVIRPCCEEADFKRGEQIFRAGENAGFLYVVLEGQIELHEEDVNETPVLSTLSGGSAFGWSALVSPTNITCQLTVPAEPARCSKWNGGVLQNSLKKMLPLGIRS